MRVRHWPVDSIHVYHDPVDMRKSIDGLAAIVELELERSPFAPALFVFCNRQRDKVAQSYALQHGHCWAHARRKFVDAEKALPKGKKSPGISAILNEIKKLYVLERWIKGSTQDGKVAARQKEAEPILTKLQQQQLKKKQHTVTPESALGKSIGCTLKYWQGLTQYLGNGCLPLTTTVLKMRSARS